ncbi:hypothetical protein VNO80_29005 [Phaseolus coccineus]|uniref:Uncharacterized protein n=1 Tax=Phaseolus coccineus TaxID=3886 RepID=A0AAN9QEL5_PHACN
MMNHGYDEESMSKQREAIANLEKEMQKQNQKFIDMEHKHAEKALIARKLIEELLERQRSLLEMENKYNDSLNMIISYSLFFQNIVEISSLQFAAVKQQNDYKNLLNLAEDLKKQNEGLNAKIIHLEQENRRVEKGKLDGLEGHQFKKVNFYKSLSFKEKSTRKQEIELDKRAHTPKLKEVEGKKGMDEDDQEVEDTEEEDQDGEENQEVENVEEENQEEREDEKLVGRLLEDVKEKSEQLSFKEFQLDQENQMIRKVKLDDLEGREFKEFKEVHFDNSISFKEERIMKQEVELYKLTHAFEQERHEEANHKYDNKDNDENTNNNNESGDDNDEDECDNDYEDHNDAYDLDGHQYKETHFYNFVTLEEEWTMRQDVELHKNYMEAPLTATLQKGDKECYELDFDDLRNMFSRLGISCTLNNEPLM